MSNDNTITQVTPDLPHNWNQSQNDKLARYCQRDGCGQTIKNCRTCGWTGCPFCRSEPCCANAKLRMPLSTAKKLKRSERLVQWGGGKAVGDVESQSD